MPAHAKLASAVVLSLALVGGGTAIAQSTTAPAGHSVYVTMVDVDGGPDEVAGTVPCSVPLHQRVVDTALGRSSCRTDDYAYAYPSDEPAPWRGDVQEVRDRMYVDRNGSMWRVAEVSYRTMAEAPEGGSELVRAMAAEILPQDGGEDLSYAMPVDDELAEGSDGELTVDVGPSPDEVREPIVADTSLPDA